MTDIAAVGNAWFDEAFATARIMAILRGRGVQRSLAIAKAAWDLGIDAVEVTLQGAEDEATLRELVRVGAERGKIVGAGTVIDPNQVVLAHRAGAAFLVSPGLNLAVVRAAHDVGIPIIPGVATPSDIQLALSVGLSWLKAFPAHWLGTDWFAHMHGPFPQVQFVATGGMDAENAQAFLNAGVRVIAVGSALEDSEQLVKLAGLVNGSAGARP
ncbi:bifunctional 4-hydroxy-2-oxoglutarate aldolase/2-dehydro-3-deoxy-phosphogluconate aldolase [Agreia sp.]|uniref:bifunctional 4-hydroxy-2-oxoglutarate aldolase/2-dehydro-3-deoxy-phosphogluconate aldolase n=1 Tax=Agreia sp. TaxID=1872416 RepID=UPI0035BBC551